jgi:uncharacterized membrane protein YpjA
MELFASLSSGGASTAWGLCLFGGLCGGTYPVFIKVPRVINAKVHPVVFQSYKSFWVFVLAWAFLAVNAIRQKPLFEFTYWAVLGASLWVPAGFFYIFAVTACGLSTTAVLTSGTSTVVQFVVSLLMKEKVMVAHGESGYLLAPWYLAGVVVGMFGLILAPKMNLQCGSSAHQTKALIGKKGEQDEDEESFDQTTMSTIGEGVSFVVAQERRTSSQREFVAGVVLAVLAGLFAGGKYCMSTIGKRVERDSQDPQFVKDTLFNVFQSYMMSFGLGCIISNVIYNVIFVCFLKARRQELPRAEFSVMSVYGFLAGLFWFGSYIGGQGANDLGSAALFGPANSACNLIVAGLWGLLWYREVRNPRNIALWVTSAAVTIFFMVMLSFELINEHAD